MMWLVLVLVLVLVVVVVVAVVVATTTTDLRKSRVGDVSRGMGPGSGFRAKDRKKRRVVVVMPHTS